MKTLYFSDNYTFDNYGTKRSLYEGMIQVGWEMIWIDKTHINDIQKLIDIHKPDQIWCAHSDLRIDSKLKKRLKVPVIGFGFSDPYYFSTERFLSYDAYVTNHMDTYFEYQKQIPIHYNPTACDLKYHKDLNIEKTMEISVIGRGAHPRFGEKDMRLTVVEELRHLGYSVHVFGNEWPEHPDNHGHITGDEFLTVINQSHLGLDIQDPDSPLAHRMFEYSGCSVPVITRHRKEVFHVFKENMEILAYKNEQELYDIIAKYMNNKKELRDIGINASKRCRLEHDITHRIEKLLPFVLKIQS